MTFTVSGTSSGERGADASRAESRGSAPRWTRRPGRRRSGPSFPTPRGSSGPTSSAGPTSEVGEPHKALTVAKAAIQRYENADLVFLPQKEAPTGRSESRRGPSAGATSLEVTWGLKPGQEVVTDGSFLLKTEIMKGSIGAGCCD